MSVTVQTDSRGVATLTLDRPEKHNALDVHMVAALHAHLRQLAADRSVRVVVLTGAGSSFCAGGDIAHMSSMLQASEAENLKDAHALATCFRALDDMEVPVVARIQGNAFGGAVGLIAAADVAIAADTARFALSEVRLGLIPAAISPFVLRAVGERQGRRLFLTAESFDAAEARHIGLVHAVTSSEELDGVVAQRVEWLLRGGPEAQKAAKHLVRMVSNTLEAAALDLRNAQLLARLRVSPEGQEGLAAFLEKRPPSWIAGKER
jgi:methylglutaconyl-CoA hydratase